MDSICYKVFALLRHSFRFDISRRAKSWFLGWYSNRHATINPTSSSYWHGKLVGVDDHVKGQTKKGEHHVVAKIGTNLFLMYNRKEGVNSEVVGDPDKVTVVEQEGEQQQSWKLAALDTDQVYRKNNWKGTTALVVKVCERKSGKPDYARVLVYTEEGKIPTCSDPLTTAGSAGDPTPFTTCRVWDGIQRACRRRRNKCGWNKKKKKCWNKRGNGFLANKK